MGIEIVRIDDRLIHGQVIIGWTRSKGIEEVIAVDDKVAKDKFQSQNEDGGTSRCQISNSYGR